MEMEWLHFFSVFFQGPLPLGFAFLSVYAAFAHLIPCFRYTVHLHSIKEEKKSEFSIFTRVLYLSDIILNEHKIWDRFGYAEGFLSKKK